MTATQVYPASAAERTRWIVEARGAKNAVRSDRAYAQMLEQEPLADGTIADVATIFLTNRECPWRCVMCDLWRNTAPSDPGSIPAQIDRALHELSGSRKATVLKLYNSGSFFDSGTIPKSDWPAIAALCRRFDHVILECHPRLISPQVLEFAEMLTGSIEIAMGLETTHPQAVESINKRATIEDFRRATAFLRANAIAVRTFLLVGVPFIEPQEQEYWLQQSINFAFAEGSDVISLIPTRRGNGALDRLEQIGKFREPDLRELECGQQFGLGLRRGRTFADTWDIERFSRCNKCYDVRFDRIATMNLTQKVLPPVECGCGS